VVRGDGGGGKAPGPLHVLRGLAGGDVLENDFQLGEIAPQRHELLLDEHSFAVEQVDVGAGDLAVHQQRHVGALHRFERAVGLARVGHSRIAVGSGARRIQLDRDDAGLLGAGNLLRRQVVGEVERHQRLEIPAFGDCGKDALVVLQRLLRRGHRRAQVGHDDGPAKLGCRVRHHRQQRLAVAHVQVPVVGAGDGEGLGSGRRVWRGHARHCPIVQNTI